MIDKVYLCDDCGLMTGKKCKHEVEEIGWFETATQNEESFD